MQAREISKAIYTEFLQRHSLDNVWQTTMMGDMQEARGRHVLYLGIFDDTDTLTGATNVVLDLRTLAHCMPAARAAPSWTIPDPRSPPPCRLSGTS